MRSGFFFAILVLVSAGCESRLATAPSTDVAALTGDVAVRPAPSSTFAASIQHHAALTDAGAVAVTAHLSCPSGNTVLEAFVMLSQRDSRIAGQGGFPGVVCDGTSRPYVALVHPVEGQFRPGAANASGYLLVCDAAGNCPSLNFSRRVVVRK
jgi:hypothetical protein